MHSSQAKIAGLTSFAVAHAPKLIGKELPFGIGSILSGMSALGRLRDKDFLGAGLDLGSAALSPLPGLGTAGALGLDTVNLIRDFANTPQEEEVTHTPTTQYRFINPEENIPQMKTADTQFQQDLENPSAGESSDLHKAIAPLISSPEDATLTGASAARNKDLKEQVRKGLVGLQYLTGLKKNVGETFYDAHPAQAVAMNALSNAVPIGAGVAGAGALTNYLRQMSNMAKTEPAKMSRTENPLDTTNPASLLDPNSKNSTRSDISRLFGDLEHNPQKRLELLDQLHGSAPGTNTFGERYKNLSNLHEEASLKSADKMRELQTQLAASLDPKERGRIESLMRSGGDAHKLELANIEKETAKLLAEAKRHPANAALHKYVNLHESLRRAREKGGMKAMIGEGSSALGGVKDLFEKYHVTGAHEGFHKDLAKQLIHEYAGGHASPEELRNFMSGALEDLGSATHQRSGLGKAIGRIKGPLLYGSLAAAGGAGLYKLLKSIQDQAYSEDQTAEWKKTLLKSRGDFDAAARIDSERQKHHTTQPQ